MATELEPEDDDILLSIRRSQGKTWVLETTTRLPFTVGFSRAEFRAVLEGIVEGAIHAVSLLDRVEKFVDGPAVGDGNGEDGKELPQ